MQQATDKDHRELFENEFRIFQKIFIKLISPCEYYAGQRVINLDRRNRLSNNLPFCDCYEAGERLITGCNRQKNCLKRWLNLKNIRTNGRWYELYLLKTWYESQRSKTS